MDVRRSHLLHAMLAKCKLSVHKLRAYKVPVQLPQHLRSRTSVGHRIGHRLQTVEGVLPILGRHETPSEIHLRLVGVLFLVMSVGSGMPDVQFSTLDRLASPRVSHAAEEEGPHALSHFVLHNRFIHGVTRRIRTPERSQDGGCGGVGAGALSKFLVRDMVNQRFESEEIEDDLVFIASAVGDFPRLIHLESPCQLLWDPLGQWVEVGRDP